MCDNCLIEADELVDLTIPAQQFLSCVVRTDQRFGITHIIQVLRGSRARRVLALQHNNLSTYGIGREYSTAQWRLLAHQFIQQHLLTRDIEHGGVQLTRNGWAVLRGEQEVWGPSIETQVVSQMDADETGNYDTRLFEQLRTKRRELADAERVPPYMVFSDRALQEMSTYLPHSTETFGTIHGVGPARVERYADSFLPIIRAYCQQHGLTEQPRQTSRAVRPTTVPSTRTRIREIGERFNAGESIAELRQAHRVNRHYITMYLDRYAQAGNPLPMERLYAESSLSPETIERVLETFDELGPDRLRPIFEAFNEEISYEELRLIRAIYWTVRSSDS